MIRKRKNKNYSSIINEIIKYHTIAMSQCCVIIIHIIMCWIGQSERKIVLIIKQPFYELPNAW